MLKHFKAVVAFALVWCLLVPTSAFPLMYAPDDPRNGQLEGHPSGGLNAKVVFAKPESSASESVDYFLLTLPWGGRSMLLLINGTQLRNWF